MGSNLAFTQIAGRLWAGALLCALICLLAGAAHGAPPRSLRFEHLSVDQGLAQESVLAIVQDKDGFMWFGSQGGLSRFDGYRVTTWRNDLADPGSLVNNWVRVLHVDAGGTMWIGTDGGLDRFDPATGRFIHYFPDETSKRGNGNRHVQAIIGDGKGGLWVGTSDGLQHFDPRSGRFTVWHRMPNDPDSLSHDQVNALALGADGTLWVGTAAGLDSMKPGAAGFEHHPDGSPAGKPNPVQALLADPAGLLWIGTKQGLDTLALKRDAGGGAPQWRRLGPEAGIRRGEIMALLRDVDGNVWVGSHNDGLYRWQAQAGRFANYRHLDSDSHSLGENQVSALYRDRVGTFWVGTWFAGVSRVDLGGGGFARIMRQEHRADTLADNKIRVIADAGNGDLWAGSSAGLNRVDPLTGATVVYRHDPDNQDSLAPGPVSGVARDARGMLWVGSRGGVTRVDPDGPRFTRIALPDAGADSNNMRGMLVDRGGTVWASSRGGLHRIDPATGAVRTYRHDPADTTSLADNVVRPMLEDRRGRFWVGTFHGLDMLDRASGKFRHYRHDPKDPDSISHDEVHYLLEDRKGDLWVGTAVGLNRMVVGAGGAVRFERYKAGDGLADDSVAAMLEDDDGNLWISSNSGLSRFNPATGKWRNYGAADGTIDGTYFDASALRAPDGALYFGGFNGITAFNPRAIRDNLVAPRAVITGFQVLNKPLAGPVYNATAVTLGADDAIFSLEFSALHYAAPQRNRFSYQLEGFDKAWVNTDAGKRFATYTNLDPGTYVFRVKAANKDGVWSASSAALEITILPPYWKTWWFRTMLALLLAGLAYAASRVRTSGLRRQKERLELQVRARTEEIGQQNRLLERQKDELEQRRGEAEDQRADAEQRRFDAERQMEEVELQKENVELAHRNISILSEIGREMTATLDMETIMSTVYRHVRQLMDAGIFSIGLYREDGQRIEFPFAIEHGVRSDVYSRGLDDPNQFAVWCLAHRREVFINDVRAEYDNYIGTLTAADAAPHSMMYVPLIVKERVMGVLCVQSAHRNAYRRVHLDMLQTLAAHAAVALDNARAYRQLEETQARLVEQEKQVRLNADELRLAKQRAEDATRQKSEFLANMSHEMRTPLAGVIGMLGFALRDARLQHSTRDQILRGQANAQSLLSIINDLLDFSKIEAGKLTIENIDFALDATVENVVSLFEEQAAAASVGFRVRLAPDLPQYVVGDPTRVRQVLVNLVGNAFKFTDDGMVTLSVERRAADQRPGAPFNMIRFSVADTGIGIPLGARARLFQKFEQADSTTTRRYGGTGLGLAICRQLVELMGGGIGVESAEGEGSTFSFVLPLADGVAPPLVAQVPLEPHSHRLRVLCAEDFPTNQIIIRMMLEELGHQVDIADNGALALAACARERYDLILMDGRMPEMDGATATRLIRAGGPPEAPVTDSELLIVALTANASEEDRARYLASGMDDFLTKPIDASALHHQVSRAIERQLARGIALAPLAGTPGRHAPSTAQLDAMFGVSTGPTPIAEAALLNAGRRAGDLDARMRAAFARDLPARRAELKAAMAAEDRDTAGRLLHGLRGSAAYLEAGELQLLCGELEAGADAGRWPELRAAQPHLERLLDAFEAATLEAE